MPTPYDFGDFLDKHSLGTVMSPGKCTITGHERVKAWDVKAAKGQTGASSSLNGDPIGQFQVVYELSPEPDDDGLTDFDRWTDFQRLIESTTNGPKPTALPFYHPDTARNHFTEVSNAGVGGFVYDGKGGATVTVKYIEYKPPKPKPAAKAAAKPGGPGVNLTGYGGSTSKPDPNAAAKAELAGLLDQARKP
jgi:hypothetical protein